MEAMKYGYARVSTEDADMQLGVLKRAGCKTIFTDQLSGAIGIKRPSLLRCLKNLQPGDTLIVWKLDRLGRGVRDLITNALRPQKPRPPKQSTRRRRQAAPCGR